MLEENQSCSPRICLAGVGDKRGMVELFQGRLHQQTSARHHQCHSVGRKVSVPDTLKKKGIGEKNRQTKNRCPPSPGIFLLFKDKVGQGMLLLLLFPHARPAEGHDGSHSSWHVLPIFVNVVHCVCVDRA